MKDQRNIICFCDNDEKKWGTQIEGIEIVSPQRLLEFKDVEIIITSHYSDEIVFQLYKMGIENFYLFNLEIIPYCNEKVILNNSKSSVSYSQEGEDMILREIFIGQREGFYIDVGAHHPKRFSNTYHFYQKGWRGINIEPLPESKEFFDFIRPYDNNLGIGISDQTGEIEYYMFNEPALNTFDKNIVQERLSQTNYKLIDTKIVKVDTLSNILNRYAKDRDIDFMSIDVEGFELNVIKSNDWVNFRPKVLLIESTGKNIDELKKSKVFQFIESQGYTFFAKTTRTCFFKERYPNF